MLKHEYGWYLKISLCSSKWWIFIFVELKYVSSGSRVDLTIMPDRCTCRTRWVTRSIVLKYTSHGLISQRHGMLNRTGRYQKSSSSMQGVIWANVMLLRLFLVAFSVYYPLLERGENQWMKCIYVPNEAQRKVCRLHGVWAKSAGAGPLLPYRVTALTQTTVRYNPAGWRQTLEATMKDS